MTIRTDSANSNQPQGSASTQDPVEGRQSRSKQKTRHIQLSFRIVIDDVNRSAIVVTPSTVLVRRLSIWSNRSPKPSLP